MQHRSDDLREKTGPQHPRERCGARPLKLQFCRKSVFFYRKGFFKTTALSEALAKRICGGDFY